VIANDSLICHYFASKKVAQSLWKAARALLPTAQPTASTSIESNPTHSDTSFSILTTGSLLKSAPEEGNRHEKSFQEDNLTKPASSGNTYFHSSSQPQ
jgi:hypothetical protein